MNIPYIKRYNKLGYVINPITIAYVSRYPNRRTRREKVRRFNNRREIDSRPVQWVRTLTKRLVKILHKNFNNN